MKKIIGILILFTIFTACNQETKKSESKKDDVQKIEQKQQWVLDTDASSVHWTGYKMTDQVPVNGVFKTFEITGVKPNEDMLATVKRARIRINVYSIFSNEESRDKKLVEYLFGKMMETNNINARIEDIVPSRKQIMLNINMNNHEKIVPMNYQIDEKNATLTMEGKIDLVKDFDAGEPLYFLHTACEDLHRGKDGVSKTWPNVSIKAILKYNKQ